MKKILIILGVLFVSQVFAQEYIPFDNNLQMKFDNNLRYDKIVKLGDQTLLKTYRYNPKIRRDVYTFYDYKNDTISTEFIVRDSCETISIAENDKNYYCLIRNKIAVELLQTSKKRINWKTIYTINDVEKDNYDLMISNKRIVILSNSRLYYKFKNKFKIQSFNDTWMTRYNRIYYNHAFSYFLGDMLFIANDRGEFGGKLLRFQYDKRKDNFTYVEMINDNVKKIVLYKNELYAISLLEHMSLMYNTLYKINGDSIYTVYSQNNFNNSNNNLNNMKIDWYNWKDIVSGFPILSIETYNNSLYILIRKKGIYKLSENNNLELVKPLDVDRYFTGHDGKISYSVRDIILNLQAIEGSLYLIHNVPIITKVGLK